MITYVGHWVDDTYKGGETRVRGVGSDLSFLGLVKVVEEVVGVNSHNNEIKLHASLSHAVGVSRVIIRDDEDVVSILRDERVVVVFVTVKAGNANNIPHKHGSLSLANDTVMVVSDDDASDQIEDDVEKDDTADRNNELRYDCEDDYFGGHEDCSEDDRVEQTDIPDCNHADDGRGHTTTIMLNEVEMDDHCKTVELKDVEGANPIYENVITLENRIRSPDDSDQERVNTGVEFKQALSMLALKEHFEFRVKKSCHARFEVGCKDKACKFALCATKLLEGEYWHVRTLHKPVVAIDATHLKGKFKGILFVAVCKDANEQIYPLAFGIGHVEDEESWSWFLNQLRRTISCPENAMFISDQHLGIKNAVEKVYKDAHHSLLSANVQPLNSAQTITKLSLGMKDMRFPFTRLGIFSEWDIPNDVQQNSILPPSWRGQAGRPRRKRIPSVGEGSGRRRCSQCKRYGHNRQNCSNSVCTSTDKRGNIIYSTDGSTISTQGMCNL
ncbi:Transposase [Theobroma cacao]|nr:Transposase [Theobroma cacao]